MQTPLVSVIIPNFNNAQYINECIMSVINQSYSNIEIVIYDDKSTDNSIQIINKLSNKFPNRIILIQGDKNVGVTTARHIAIKNSNGKFLTTLDSDDFYCNTKKIENEINIILSNPDRNIISFSKIKMIDKDGNFIKYQFESFPVKQGYIFDEILQRSCFIPRDFVFSRNSYFVAGGFDLNIPLYEDWDLKIRLALSNEFIYTNEDGIAYRKHDKGLSKASILKHNKWIKYIKNKYK